MKNASKENDHSKISPTAKITAYWRSLSDIPYSKEIADAVDAEQTARELLEDRIASTRAIPRSMFEVRYKSINYGLAKCGINNVLELACGLSPRGLEIVSKGGTYVGTDLPEMHAESSRIILNIASREGIPTDHLHLQPANVLDKNELENAVAHFGDKRFAICNEGLLPYLDMEEKARMAENIRNLLLKNGACWITTDVAFKALREAIASLFTTNASTIIKSAMKNITKKTGRDILENDFDDQSQAQKFYEDLGFVIEEFPMYAGNYILSTDSLIQKDIKERFMDILSSAKAWILTPRR